MGRKRQFKGYWTRIFHKPHLDFIEEVEIPTGIKELRLYVDWSNIILYLLDTKTDMWYIRQDLEEEYKKKFIIPDEKKDE